MTKQELLKAIELTFIKNLQAKTGWGRNEIIHLYRESVGEVIIANFDSDPMDRMDLDMNTRISS